MVSKKTAAWYGVMGFLLLVWIVSINIRWNNKTPRIPAGDYTSPRICEDAYSQSLDFANFSGNRFTVPLRDQCFGGVVRSPKTWHHWTIDSSPGDTTGAWYSIWIVGEPRPRGPVFPNSRPEFTYREARFRGKGSLVFATNDVAPIQPTDKSSSKPTAPEAPAPIPLSGLQVWHEDARSCDKPDDVTYGGNPKFLFDVHNNGYGSSDTKINWSGGFKGKVPVCFIVDEKGNPTAIHLLQPLKNPELERRINEVVSGWRYQAGIVTDPQTLEDRRRRLPRTTHAVKTQMMYSFDFH